MAEYRDMANAPIQAWLYNPTPNTIKGMSGGLPCTIEPNHKKCHFDKNYIDKATRKHTNIPIPLNGHDAEHMASLLRQGKEGLVVLKFGASEGEIRAQAMAGLMEYVQLETDRIQTIHSMVGGAIANGRSDQTAEKSLIKDRQYMDKKDFGEVWFGKPWITLHQRRIDHAQELMDNIDSHIKKIVSVDMPEENEQIRGFTKQLTAQATEIATLKEQLREAIPKKPLGRPKQAVQA